MIRVLFVDDEQELLDIGKCFLETYPGLVVDPVQSARHALSLVKKYQYDAIVSDYLMPEIDGLDFLRRVRSINPRIPFIFFTGQGDEKTVINALNSGADFYLKKNSEAGSKFLELYQLIKLSVARFRSEISLEMSEEKFRTIADFSYDWIYWMDPQGSLTYISPSCERICGYTQEEFYQNPDLINQVIYPDDKQKWLSHCEAGTRLTGFVTLDLRIAHKDGGIRWISHTCQPVHGPGGEYLGRRVNNRDITGRKQVEDQLQHEHDNFLKIFEAAPVGLLLMDRTTVITRANEAIGVMVLRDPAEIIRERGGGGLGCIHSFEDSKGCGFSTSCPGCPLRQGIESVIESGTSIHGAVIPLTLRIGGRDSLRWLSINAEPVEIDGSENIIVAVDDITGQRETEDALRESEEKFRTLSEHTPAAIMMYQDEHWVYANPAAEKITGYSQEYLRTIRFWEITPPDYQETLKKQGMSRLNGEITEPVFISLPVIRPDGSIRQVEIVASSIVLGNKRAGLITAVDVTERKAAEEKLQRSEEKFRSIFENQIDLFYQSDVDGIITLLSPSCKKLTGYDPSDLIGRPVQDLYPFPEQRAGLITTLREKGSVYDYEVVLRNKEGVDVPVSINCHLVSDQNGSPRLIEGSIRDISERKRIEEALRRSEYHYRSLFDHMLEGFAYCRMIFDDQGNPDDWIYISVNQAFGQLTGLTDILGKRVTEVIPTIKELSPELFEIYGRVVSTGIPETFETFFRPLEIWLNVSVYRAEKDHFVAVFGDITRRKKDELALQNLNRDLRMILENVPAMIWYKDTHNNFIQVNRAASLTFGRTVDVIEGKNLSTLFPDKGDFYYRDDLDVIKTGKPKMGILEEFTTTKGDKIWVNTDKVPITDDEGTVTGILVLGIDITERVKAEHAITLANKKLTLLSGITRHDILNQVQGLFFSLDLANSDDLSPETKKHLEKAMDFSRNIERQIAFTRDYEDIGVKSPEWQNVEEIINRVIPFLDMGSIRIQADVQGLFVYADPLLEKVFFNLLDNARRYGEKISRIRVYGKEHADGYTLTCEDDGVGIPEKHKKGIFSREYFKHTGFGLNLSREILDITGLTISETGEAGKGARFEIMVPKEGYRISPPDEKK